VDGLVANGAQSVVVHGRTPANVDALVDRYANVLSSSLVYRPIDLIVNTIPEVGRHSEATVLQGCTTTPSLSTLSMTRARPSGAAGTARRDVRRSTGCQCWPIKRRSRCGGVGRSLDGAQLLEGLQ